MTEMTTRGYIPLNIDGTEMNPDLIFAKPLKAMEHNELVGRAEAEAAIATLRAEVAEHEGEIARLDRVVEGWKESAAQNHRNACFWQGIVDDIGQAIGRPAFTSDDSSVQADPLALRVREIVVNAYTPKNRFQRALRMLFKGY